MSTAKKIIFSVLSVLLFLIVIELITQAILFLSKKDRTHVSTQSVCMPNFYKLAPYIMFEIERNFHSELININSLGFRGEEFNPQKPKGVYRIFTVGGSAVLGIQVADNETFCAVLENMLNLTSKDRKFEVINAGRSSYLSAQEMILIEMQILDYTPDMIIVFDGLNDLHHSVVYDRRPGYPYLFDMIERSCGQTPLKRYFILGLSRGIQFLAQKSRFVGILDTNLKKIRKKEETYEPNSPVIDFYRKNLDLIAKICKSKNVKLVIASPQPFLGTKKYLSAEEQKIVHGNYLEVMVEMYKSALAQVKAVTSENKVNFINMIDVFDNEKDTVYYDVVHFSAKGHKLIAERLYKELKKSR
ncbi:MAG: hypothetical protein AB1349_04470 [Elusimicrobiota bacterium]